jgi:putative ABC transport system permease protein
MARSSPINRIDMKLLESSLIAIRSLLSNKMRSALTMLGIVIGVTAVISLMSLGRGTASMVTSTFEQLGTNVLYVMPRSPETSGMSGLSSSFAPASLTLDDAKAIQKLGSVAAVAPVNENMVLVTYGSEGKTCVLDGSTPDYRRAYAYTVASGQFINEANVNSRDSVAVLGSQVARDLFGTKDPIGERVKIKGIRFDVVGVLEPKGGGMMGVSLDDVVVVPITTFQTRLFTNLTATGQDAVQSISVQAASPDLVNTAIDDIESALRKRHRIAEGAKADFAVVSQEQVLGIFSQITGVFTIFLGAVAGISLLVGGIGIMNIMLVSVTERTREIGIRKAIGAKRRDILLQFLIEAALLSLLGGAIGILGGWSIAYVVSQIPLSGMTIKAVVSPDIVILAVSVSLFIGLASGIYPAMRAARLNPIDALHYG